jgi:hypothetical protein
MFGLSIKKIKLKIKNMELQVLNQEILLFTGSGFCNRRFCEGNGENENNNDLSSMEELEKACWDGMLYEMLPELVGNPTKHRDNYIWNTVSGVNFLCINMGICSAPLEKQTSIDPYLFLHATDRNN